ncbi:hypothetical protein [Achromobacter sp. JUb104]|uniref:DUF7661 family protein n=1 Tax=Achromobacter sp. JUb104 TaxID=2940590 RepID=UPI00216914C6|nr:hypothetical protein [Achromobacter sp. JUb104]MCS3509288.1 hypothetical protein [Achromobacter sp. JUb104]
MKFDVYGKFSLEVTQTPNGWVVYRNSAGKRVPETDIVIPPDIAAEDLAEYLDDLLHELSPLGGRIVEI